MNRKHACAGAELVLTEDGVLLVRWRGVVTMRTAEATKRAAVAWLPARPAGIVSDYRRAAVAMSYAELVRIMVGDHHDLPELPAVVLASDNMWDAFYRASLTAAAFGRWRYVSRRPAEAQAQVARLRRLAAALQRERAEPPTAGSQAGP